MAVLDELRAELDDFVSPSWDRHVYGAPYCLFGSSVLALHGIDIGREPGDADVFVHPELWHQLANLPRWRVLLPDPADPPYLRQRYDAEPIDGSLFEASLFYRWTARDPEVNADFCRYNAEVVRGWLCAPLEVIRLHKVMAMVKWPDSDRHAKHRRDVAAIDVYLRFKRLPTVTV